MQHVRDRVREPSPRALTTPPTPAHLLYSDSALSKGRTSRAGKGGCSVLRAGKGGCSVLRFVLCVCLYSSDRLRFFPTVSEIAAAQDMCAYITWVQEVFAPETLRKNHSPSDIAARQFFIAAR